MKRMWLWATIVLIGGGVPEVAWAQRDPEFYGPHMMWGSWYGVFMGPLMMILFMAVVVVLVVLEHFRDRLNHFCFSGCYH